MTQKTTDILLDAIKECEIFHSKVLEIFQIDVLMNDYYNYEKKVIDRMSYENSYYSPIKNSYISENELLSEFIELLFILKEKIQSGDFYALKNISKNISVLLTNQFLDELLSQSIGTYSNKIIPDIDFIIDNLNFEDYYENNISNIPIVIKELTEEMMFQISNNTELIYNIDPFVFEQFVAKILIKFKMQVQLQKKTRDGGIDIIAFKDEIYTENYYIFECKRYTPHKKVGIDIVQRLYGVKKSERANKAFLVTSSTFTKDAMKFCAQHYFDLQLVDYIELSKWLNIAYPK
jgi:HJR/Mrr/RecB family endonuclease